MNGQCPFLFYISTNHTAKGSEVVSQKELWHIFFCDYDLTIAMGDALVSGFSDKYKVYGLFLNCRPQLKFNWVFKVN